MDHSIPGLAVVWQDEDGHQLETFLEPGFDTGLLVARIDNTACLRFVDPYGDTIFNQLQLPVLVREIEALYGALEPDLEARAKALAVFLRGKQDQVHTYIRIVGD